MTKQILAGAAALIATLAFTPVAQAQFTESFDGYPAGTAIEGQGGWQNWDICGTGNQPWNTVSTSQSLSGGNSLRLLGADAAGAAGCCPFTSDTTHELNGPYTSGTWTFSIWQYVPSSFFGDSYIIMLNDYGNCGGPYNWSVQAHVDSAQGVNGMMVMDVNGTATVINGDQPALLDQWVEFKVEIDLDNDVAIAYYNCVAMYTFPWSTGVSASGGTATIDALDLFPGTDDTTEVFYDNVSMVAGITPGCPIGSNYCMANPNSTGGLGAMGAVGSVNVADNAVILTASGVPNNSFGFFITSLTTGFVMNPNGSQGNLCVLGAIGRYVGPGQIQNSGSAGSFSLTLDLTQTPQPTGLVSVMSGETWHFQAWHRDFVGGPTSNFTDGLSISFL